jgi:dolichyl-phosphate beta-glucosyltransferase
VERLLSVLLPVKDAQSTLEASVHEILDVATDFGERFEVLIIDDGSTDATSEVAHDLTCYYPQIRVVHHGTSLGREAAIRTGLKRSQGEVVMLRDDDSTLYIIDRAGEACHTTPSRPAAPNYLSRLRDFVSAE